MNSQRILQVIRVLCRIIHWIAAAIVVLTASVIAVTLLLGVIVRYVLHGSVAWAAELPIILFPWLIMAGIVLAASNDKHLGVDYLVRHLPPVVSRGVALAMQCLVIALMVTLAAQAPGLLRFLQYQATPVLGWPASWAFYSVPVGALGVAALALLRIPELFLNVAVADAPAAAGSHPWP